MYIYIYTYIYLVTPYINKYIYIIVQRIKLDENKAFNRTFIRGYSRTFSYFNFFIIWSLQCLNHLISRTLEIAKFFIQQQYFTMPSCVLQFLFYIIILTWAVPNISKCFDFYARYQRTIEVLFVLWKPVVYLETSQTSEGKLFCRNR